METLKRESARWWPAVIAAGRYILLTNLTAAALWLEAVTPRWAELTDLDWSKFWLSQAITCLTTVGAIMNDKWSKARNVPPLR